MKRIFAKSGEKVLLTDHSIGVKNVALSIFNMLPINNDIIWSKVIELSSLLHDIGKSTTEFQKNLKKGVEGISKNKFRHNEIGWAFCYRYLNVPSNILTPILYCVYWHHGISNKLNTHSVSEILNSISQEDINDMKDILIQLLGEDHLLTEERDYNDLYDVKSPKFYSVDIDYESSWPAEKLKINRIILISSDQLQSKLESGTINSISSEIDKIIKKDKVIDSTLCPKNYDLDRHNKNIEIANSCTQTTVINGTGGMGKTDIGFHWTSKSNRPFINVCPMNIVARSVYNNSLSINNNYNLDLTLQLFLTAEVTKTNSEFPTPFSSDVNVTNIDNFVKPQVDDKSDNHIERLLMLLFADIQIDEYHELVMNAALFRLFVIIMKMRHNYTDARTLLTSATPIPLEHQWDTLNNKTTILPERNKHYPAPHNKKFKVTVIEGNLSKEELHNNNTLVIFNSIKESQKYKNIYGIDELIHSDFQRSDIDRKLQYLYNNYGKQSPRTTDKPNVIGARMVQTSIDMSFSCLVESVCSPQDSLQRIPRINRWGDYDKICELKFFRANSLSEDMVKKSLYNIDLSDKWFEELLALNGCEVTLDELNVVYNKFNEKYNNEVKQLIRRRYTESMESLSELYPIRFNDSPKKTKTIIAGSNKLRTSGNELMIISEIYGESKYCEPICQRIYNSIDQDFSERNYSPRNDIIRVYKKLEKMNDDRFDFKNILDDEKKNNIG